MAYDRDRTFLVGIASRLVGSHQYQRLSLFASVLEDSLQQRTHSAFESESRPRWPDPSQGWSPCQRGVARSLCALHAARAIKMSPETQASCSRCRIVKLSRYCHGRILEYSYLFLYYMQQQCPNKLPVKFSEKRYRMVLLNASYWIAWPLVASPTWSSTEQVARPATKRFHPSHWRPL